MKKFTIFFLLLCLYACNSNEQEKTQDAPGAIDNSTQHPNGVTNGSVMSRDTAAMRVDTQSAK